MRFSEMDNYPCHDCRVRLDAGKEGRYFEGDKCPHYCERYENAKDGMDSYDMDDIFNMYDLRQTEDMGFLYEEEDE